MKDFIMLISIPVILVGLPCGVFQLTHNQNMEIYQKVTECRKSVEPNKNPDIICGTLPMFIK